MVKSGIAAMTKDVSVIIRSVGERTEALCKKLILEQGVPEENVVIVKEAPFSAAMKKSFQIGIELRLPWTFCVDADVLLRPDSIKQLLGFADKQKNNVAEIQGLVLDKFFGGPRPAGNHLYRTSLLEKVIEKIPREGISIRPEYYTLNRMKKAGYPWYNISLLVGLHDFEQYNLDIFRKCMVHAYKHLGWMEVFVPYWQKSMKQDNDYHVALSGLAAGIMHCEDMYIDVNQTVYSMLFARANIEEKKELNNNTSLADVEAIIHKWQEPAEFINNQPKGFKVDFRRVRVLNPVSKLDFLKSKNDEIGCVRLFPWLFGRVLEKTGARLCGFLEK